VATVLAGSPAALLAAVAAALTQREAEGGPQLTSRGCLSATLNSKFPTIHPNSRVTAASDDQSSFRLINTLRPSNVLPARPPRLTGSCTTFATQVEFQLSRAGQYAWHLPASRIWGVGPLTQRPQNNVPLSKFADRRHHFGCVSPKAVDTHDDDGVAVSGFSQKSQKH
jgi:hypothetical protein